MNDDNIIITLDEDKDAMRKWFDAKVEKQEKEMEDKKKTVDNVK